MAILRYIEKIRTLDFMIRRKATGNQKEFARKASLSRSMLNEYLKEMKEMGFPIGYCRKRHTYFYEKEGRMVSNLFEHSLAESESKTYKGGKQVLLILGWHS